MLASMQALKDRNSHYFWIHNGMDCYAGKMINKQYEVKFMKTVQ